MPPLGADPAEVTVSGFSSGAIMAHNLHLIYSDTIKGGAFYEGGSYGTFFSDPEHSMEVWKDKIPEAEKNGWIDPTKNLEGHPVMIISGADDQVLRPPVQK